jgi:hypothetical protein
VILLNKVIQILILTDLDFLTSFFEQHFDGGGIGPALIKGNFSGRPCCRTAFLRKPGAAFLSRCAVSEPEVDGLTLSVESPIQLLPPAKRCPRGVSCG